MAESKLYALNELPQVQPVTGQSELYKYGSNDFYPNELVNIINNSSSAKNCLRKLQSYIVGNGFANLALNEQKIDGKRYIDLLAEIAYQVALFEAVAIRVVYGKQAEKDENGNSLIVDGEIIFRPIVIGLEVLSIEKLRKRKDGIIVYNPNRQYSDKPSDRVFYKPFESLTDAELLNFVDEQKGLQPHEKGMVLYAIMKQPQADIYPLPAWATNKEAVKAQGLIFQFLEGELENGFFPSMVVTVNGDPQQTTLTEGQEQGESFPEVFKKAIKENVGAKNAGRVAVLFQSNPDMKVSFEQINSNAKTEELVNLSDGINQMIATVFNIPLSLANVATAGSLGSNQQMRLEIDWFNDSLSVYRHFIAGVFAKLFGVGDWALNPKNPFMAIDPALVAVLTPDEIRAKFGEVPLTKEVIDKTPAEIQAETIITKLSSFSALLQNKVFDILTVNEQRGLLGLAPVEGGSKIPTPNLTPAPNESV